MKEVSKFIPIDGNEEVGGNTIESAGGIGVENTGGYNGTTGGDSTFKVCGNPTNLPAKPTGFFSKLKSILFYEINVELTPQQQKVEDEINEFLHQEVTWQSFKNFLFQDIKIT